MTSFPASRIAGRKRDRYQGAGGEDEFEIDKPPDPGWDEPPLKPGEGIEAFRGWSVQEPDPIVDLDDEGKLREYRFPIIGTPLPPPPPSEQCCVKEEDFKYPIPKNPEVKAFDFGAYREVWWRFTAEARFIEDKKRKPPCKCACCEFRQYVSVLRRQGAAIGRTDGFVEDCAYRDDDLASRATSIEVATKWRDAGTGRPLDRDAVARLYKEVNHRIWPEPLPPGLARHCYGRKDIPMPSKEIQARFTANQGYLPTKADWKNNKWRPPATNACFFWMTDEPHQNVTRDGSLMATFRGEIIDVCNGGRVRARKEFTIKYPETVKREDFTPAGRK